MAKIQFTCTYCGKVWCEVITYSSEIEYTRCSKCGDKNLKKVKYESVDYYSDKIEIKEKLK